MLLAVGVSAFELAEAGARITGHQLAGVVDVEAITSTVLTPVVELSEDGVRVAGDEESVAEVDGRRHQIAAVMEVTTASRVRTGASWGRGTSRIGAGM